MTSRPTPPFVAHTKAWAVGLALTKATRDAGDYSVDSVLKKNVEVVVLSTESYGDIVVRASNGGVTKISGGGDTTEGRRFVRVVRPLLKLLSRIAKDGANARARAERAAKVAKAREGRDGVCQICERSQIVAKGKLVLHGYQRPGDGQNPRRLLRPRPPAVGEVSRPLGGVHRVAQGATQAPHHGARRPGDGAVPTDPGQDRVAARVPGDHVVQAGRARRSRVQ